MRREYRSGLVWRFPLMMALIAGFFVALVPLGWVLAHASDAIGGWL